MSKHHQPDQATPNQPPADYYQQVLQSFLTATSDAVYRMSADWRQMHQLSGKSFLLDTATTNSSWLQQYIPPPDQQQLQTIIEEAIVAKKPFELEHRVIRADGSLGWTFSRAIPLLDKQGEITEWFGTASDITGQKQAQEALAQSEEKYRMLFNSIDEGFVEMEMVMDEAGRVLDWRWLDYNPAFERMSGLTGKKGQLFSEIVPKLEPEWAQRYGHVVATGESLRFELPVVGLDSWFDIFVSRIGEEGDRKVVCVFTNITARKRQEANLAFLAEVSQDLALVTDIDQTMNALGQKIASYLGLSATSFAELDEEANPETLTAVISHGWYRDDVPGHLGTYRMDEFMTPEVMQLCLAGKAVIIRDVFEDPRTNGEQYAGLHIGSFISMPLVRDGKWRFLLVLYRSEAHDWSQEEIELTRELTTRIWTRLERARAEADLQASQTRFESIANLVPDLLWDSQPDGSTYWYNQRWLDYTGQRYEEAIGWRWTDAVHPDERAASAKRYQEAVTTGQSLRQEHRIRRHDGAYRWFVVNTYPLKDQTGQVVKMYGAATDIHESRLYEEALQESEKRFRLAIEATELATWEWNLDTDQVYWNEQHFRLFGMEPRQGPLRSEEFMRHVHPQEQDRIKHLLEQAIAERSIYEAEFCAVLDDGAQRWMSGYGRITEEQDGRPVKMSGVMFDVDDRRRTQDALRQSKERLQKALSIQTVGVIFFDRQTRIGATNEAFLAMSGVSQHDIDQRSVSLIELTLPPWRPLCQQAMSELMTEGRSQPHEKELLRPDGTRWWGLFAGSRLSEDEFIEFVLDVTERRRAEDALREADGRKDEFLAMLAHELRNPMSTLRSGLQILTITDGKDQTSSDTITMMNRQTDHLVRMVDDLLDVSRISQGKIELKTQRINLVEVVAQAAESIQTLYQEQGRRLHLDLPTTPIYLEGDATRLSQVVTNLLTNGVRYTGERGQVWLSLIHEAGIPGGQQATLQVRDDGIGLAPDQLSAIFDLFVQVDNSLARSKGGLGLGLTLVKRLVELHGGRVEAQSEGIGAGSTFRVHLPTLTTASESIPTPAEGNSAQVAAQRILVVDDNADAALMLSVLLRLKGYEVHSRQSGQAGLEAVEQLKPGVVLLDIGMPGMDGYETARAIRQQSGGRDIVLIALTGYGGDEDKQRAREAGFDEHLIKPVDLGVLTALLTKLLPAD
ncbi:PAS domain S-box protein [Spirosoma sp. RP8]|uniref:histidine kinase n=1 Tax=Spirosoma liriopis TaxID=2937440 RepID=A0ABT0HDZ2_9BACT|nr:PAS domain S-box protein [Spirosoma liriopis]MCK8490210.1 PAS domain S-box protein [Spirosoma liriopis]